MPGFGMHQACTWHTDMHTCKTPTHMIKHKGIQHMSVPQPYSMFIHTKNIYEVHTPPEIV